MKMKPLLALATFLGFTLFWACHLGPEEESDTFDVVGDTAWMHCDTLELLLLDSSGSVQDTLFRDSLRSLGQLRGLDAGRYRGGDASIRIHGFFRNGSACVDMIRSFGEDGSNIKGDTLVNVFASPESVVAEPAFLSLVGDGAPQKVRGRVLPAYTDQALYWSMDSSGVATVDVAAGVPASEARVAPESLGEGYLTLRSRKDPRKSTRVRVRVSPIAATSVFLDDDSLLLYAHGPTAVLGAVVLPRLADPAVLWTSTNPLVATVDTGGRVAPAAPGRTMIYGTTGNGMRDSAVVTVVLDVPRLTVAHKPGAPVNEIITFTPSATQKVGHLVLYAWDLQGDGAWDDSLALQWFGDSVVLPQQSARYSKEGEYRPRFRVRDSEGNTAIAVLTLDIGNQPPDLYGLPGDTVISIRDSLPMTATAHDRDGQVVWAGWDYEGDGQFDDTVMAADAEAEIVLGHRYLEAGNYLSVVRVMDDKGKIRQDTVRVRVELDAPVADAGPDLVVIVNDPVNLRVDGKDRLGTIVRREFKLGNGPFIALSGADTLLLAPPEPAELDLVVRVTDDDSLSAVDSARISVILSANSDLTDLSLSAGALSPAFRPDVGSYSARVGYGDSLVHIVATARDPAAEISVNGQATVPGTPSEPVRLAVGANPGAFQVRVAAPDGSVRNYAVSVVRNPSASATLKALTGTGFVLEPAFSPDTLAYLDTVPASVSSITLRPTASMPGASITVDGAEIASGTPTPALPLQFGDNFFRIDVTAEDGAGKTSYIVRIVRLAKLLIYRKLGSAAPVLADSAELPLGVVRPLSSAGVTGHTFASWTLLEGRATLEDTASNPTAISVGTGTARVQAAFTINRYTLSASSSGCGALNPAPGEATYTHGVNVAYALIPTAGCRIRSVLVDGVEDTSGYDGSFAFNNLSASHALRVEFARYFTLTGAVSGSGGTIWPAAPVQVDSGSDYSYDLISDDGKKVYSFKDNGVLITPTPTATYTLEDIRADHHGEVVFAGGFTLTTAVALGSGTITPASAGVDSGASQVFRFRPSANYRFLGLTDNGAAAAPIVGDTQYTLSGINRAHHLAVRFRRLFTLGVSSRGCGAVNGSGGTVDSSSSPAFTFAPASGCKVDSVFVNNASIGPAAGYTFAGIAQNSTLRVVFTRVFTVSTTWGTNGTNGVGGSVSPANPGVDSMDAVTLSLGAAIGYRRQSLTVNGAAVTPVPTTYTFPAVTANQSLRLGLIRTFNQTSSVAGPGSGTISPSLATVDTLASQTFTFAPAVNYRFHSLTVNGAAATPSGSGQHVLAAVNRDNAVQVRFWRQYTVAVTSTGCGTVSPAGGLVDSASSPVYSFTLPEGCTLDTLIANGSAIVPPPASYTFNTVTGNRTLRAVFKQSPLFFTVTTTWGTSGDNRVGGSITPANPSVGTGKPVTLAIDALAGYRRLSFAVNGTAITPVPATHTIPSVTAPMTAHAAFLRTFVQTGAVAQGMGSIAPASQTVDTLASQAFTFSPAANYRFHSLLVNGTAVTPSGAGQHVLSAVNRDNAVQVRFLRQYTITTSATGCGAVPAGGVRDSASNNSFAFTIPAGCRIDSLLVNSVPVTPAASYAFNNLSQNQTLRAVFVTTYTVATTWATTGTAGVGGSVTPANPVVDAGGSVTLAIQPAAGYRRYAFRVNGNPVPQVTATYAFNALASNQAFHADFWRVFRVTGMASPGGTVTPAQADIDSAGSVQMTITPNPGYVIDTVWDNKVVKITNGGSSAMSYVLNGVNANHEVTATFRGRGTDGYRLTLSDSVALGAGEAPPESPTKLCVTWDGQGGSGEKCGTPNVDMTIPQGSSVRIQAQESVRICARLLCEDRPFSHWLADTGRKAFEIKENPAGFQMTSQMALRAVYAPGQIIGLPPILGVEPSTPGGDTNGNP